MIWEARDVRVLSTVWAPSARQAGRPGCGHRVPDPTSATLGNTDAYLQVYPENGQVSKGLKFGVHSLQLPGGKSPDCKGDCSMCPTLASLCDSQV